MGDSPWGDVFSGKLRGGQATGNSAPRVATGFEIEKLYDVRNIRGMQSLDYGS